MDSEDVAANRGAGTARQQGQVQDRYVGLSHEENRQNPLLSRACIALRRNRPELPRGWDYTIHEERVNGRRFVRLWFRTGGCRLDRRGCCTMCNYGSGGRVDPLHMVSTVRQALARADLDERTILLISPSGSMLDSQEVPRDARREILELVSATDSSEVICESRVETITSETVREFRGILSSKRVSIEVGLESSNDWIRRFCVNKSMHMNDYRRAIHELNRSRVRCITNVSVGTAFLSPSEAIDDAVSTVRFALAAGSDQCVLFPLAVKDWTLIAWLWRHHRYQPPSLWSLVEVLNRLGEEASKVTISWYRDYTSESGRTDPATLSFPTTCPDCSPDVLRLLDAFRGSSDLSVIDRLSQYKCRCREAWLDAVDAPRGESLQEVVAHQYEFIGRQLLGADPGDEIMQQAMRTLRTSATAR